MDRKTIGCLLADLEGNFNTIIWREIYRAAQKSKCSIIVFEGRAIKDPSISVQHNFIYELAQKTEVDGYLFNSSQLCRFIGNDKFQAFCQPYMNRNLPVASLGLPIKGAKNILVDSREGLRKLISHLLENHDFRRPAFIRGPENNAEANERYEVYLEVLKHFNIPFDSSLVESGDFSTSAGYQAYKHLDENHVDLDCIICVNDDTAAGVYRYLMEQKELGHILPTEFITGFDNTIVSQLNDPPITTVSQPFTHMADYAFEWLLKSSENELTEEVKLFPSELVIRSSCGCDLVSRSHFTDELLLMAVRNFRVHQTMQTFSLEELFDEIDTVLVTCAIRSCFIVMFKEPVHNDETAQFPDTAHLIYRKQGNVIEHLAVPLEFQTSTLIPVTLNAADDCTVLIVKPLFFRHEQMGYIVFEPMNHSTRDLEVIRGHISNMLKIIHLFIRQKEIEVRLANAVDDLQEFNRNLNILSIHDELTGLLNRRGFFNTIQKELDDEGKSMHKFLVVFADIDGMKQINDTYGHEEGDAALKNTAKMLRSAFREDDVIARLGGDEFIVFARNVDDDFIRTVRERTTEALKITQTASAAPYTLSISFGFSSYNSQNKAELSEILRIADQNLYKEKAQKKTTGTYPM